MAPVVDFHTHILPGMDDGSRSTEESLAMLREEARQGVHCVIATPHFYPHLETPEQFLQRRAEAETRLREAMAAQPDLPKVLVGAEVYAFEGMSEVAALADMAIPGTGCVLIEMPMTVWSPRLLQELEGIRQRTGLFPVLAHIDRYLRPFQVQRLFSQLAPFPVLIQANGNFFTKRRTRRLALRLLWEQRIHLLGSDCHNMDKRPPNLAAAVQIIHTHLGEEYVRELTAYATELLAGSETL